MTAPAIRVEGLWKEYVIGSHAKNQTFREMLVDSVTSPFRRLVQGQAKAPPEEQFWALQDVSFEIQPGEVIGIIGRNGAGKSTLLKILSRITDPTLGSVHIRGRVSSLLEVGTGFHPELTGRENIFLNGAVIGMGRKEIQRKFDEIVAFADIEKFLDTPVKHYSSGMYVRLAFAVAAHLESEILLVDEVLAVGDMQFQKKCLQKMDELGHTGRTVIFISHNLGVMKRLCSRLIWLEAGAVFKEGDTATITSNYLTNGLEQRAMNSWEDRPKTGVDVALRAVRISQPAGLPTSSIDITTPFDIEVEVDFHKDVVDVNVGIMILTADGVVALHSADCFAPDASSRKDEGRWLVRCTCPAYALNVGSYSLTVAADSPSLRKLFFYEENVLRWSVQATCPVMDRYGPNAWRGISGPGLLVWHGMLKPQVYES